MTISVICPTLNEEDYIEKILMHFINSKPQDKELLIVDGGSTDKTLDIIEKWISTNKNITLFHNPERYVPFALNKAIPKCKGDIIVRIDAHTDFSTDYYESIIQTFEKTNADIVGGPTRTRYKTNYQAAIAHSINTSLAIGNSKVHFEKYEGFTDSVTFGSWRKEIFDVTGLFDTELLRNQDDEFHYRAKSKGFKIYQSPEIKLYYYPRKNISDLFKQYYQYGYFKPLVLKKVRQEWKFRHFIPSIFVLYLFSLPISFQYPLWLLPIILYMLLVLIFSFREKESILIRFMMLTVFPVLHISYGTGFLRGLFK